MAGGGFVTSDVKNYPEKVTWDAVIACILEPWWLIFQIWHWYLRWCLIMALFLKNVSHQVIERRHHMHPPTNTASSMIHVCAIYLSDMAPSRYWMTRMACKLRQYEWPDKQE
ncbi:unnamed protein product, partial [Dovyalis caffra]